MSENKLIDTKGLARAWADIKTWITNKKFVCYDEAGEVETAEPRDADTLGGYAPNYYAKETEIDALNKNLTDSQWKSDNNSTLGSRKVANDKIASALIGYVDTAYDRASIEYRDYNGTTSIVNRLLIGFNNLGDFKIIGKSGSVSKSADLLTTDNGRKYIPIYSSTTTIAPNGTFSLDVSSYDFNYFEIHYYGWNGIRQTVLLPKTSSCNFEVLESATNRGYAQNANASGGTMTITNKSTVTITIYKIFAVKSPT